MKRPFTSSSAESPRAVTVQAQERSRRADDALPHAKGGLGVAVELIPSPK